MNNPISRRSAILRLLAAVNAAEVCVWETSRNRRTHSPAQFAKIVPGVQFGDIFLGMNAHHVIACLGAPCETKNFEADEPEETLKLFAHLNEMTGSNLTAKNLRPATTFLSYHRLGLSICLHNGRVAYITASTGVLAGYTKWVKNYFPVDCIPLGTAPLRTLNDVQCSLGKADSISTLELAPIPECNIAYSQGLAFSGPLHDGLVARITVGERRVL